MTADESFLRAILAAPDDDGPRVIYADWLEEQGNPRGEFIRLQCEAARLPRGHHVRARLKARARELLARHYREWSAPLRGLALRCRFRRGFVEAVTVNARVYLDRWEEVLRLAPIRSVRLDLTDVTISQDVIWSVPESVSQENIVLPLARRDRAILFAIADPDDRDTLQKLEFILNRDIVPLPAPRKQIVEGINRHYGQTEIESVDCGFPEFVDVAHDFTDLQADDTPIVRLVNLIITEAISLRAHAIHIEPFADHIRVRYGIGNELIERDSPPRRLFAPMRSRIKVMAFMNVAEKRLPQSGAIPLNLRGQRFDLRVDTLPTVHGESIVIHIPHVGVALPN